MWSRNQRGPDGQDREVKDGTPLFMGFLDKNHIQLISHENRYLVDESKSLSLAVIVVQAALMFSQELVE